MRYRLDGAASLDVVIQPGVEKLVMRGEVIDVPASEVPRFDSDRRFMRISAEGEAEPVTRVTPASYVRLEQPGGESRPASSFPSPEKVAAGNGKAVCAECGREFKSEFALNGHRRSHEKSKKVFEEI